MNYQAQQTKLFDYNGSKSKYYNHFETLHTKTKIKQVDTYIEAFGGTLSSLFHNLQNIKANRIIINDYNSRLINLYTQIKTNHNEVIEYFLLLENTFQDYIPTEFKGKGLIKDKPLREKYLGHLRDFYNNARNVFNENKLDINNASLFLFLMQHNFNGLYKETKKGNYNTCFNWTMKTINTDKIIENIMNLHNFFINNNVIIENLDVYELVQKYSNEKSTLIYLDPPYIDSEFGYIAQENDYSKIETHLKLIKECEIFDYVMYSNNHNETMKEKMNFTINFHRTNQVAQYKETTSKKEMLSFIDNTIVVMPTIEELFKKVDYKKANDITYKEENKPFKVGTLFTGIGSTTQSLINNNINFETEFICEIDKYAKQVYIDNFNKPKVIYEDITKIDLENIPYVDFLQMSPPCVSFSSNGKRKGFEDKRGNLVFDSLNVLKKIRPKYFLFENVKGLLNSTDGKDFQDILDYLKKLDYNIKYKVLNSLDFETCQFRERLFIFGTRKDIKTKFEFPIGSKKRVVLNDYIKEQEDYSKSLFNYNKELIRKVKPKPRSAFTLAYRLKEKGFNADNDVFSSNGLVPCFLSGSCHSKIIDTKHNIFRYMTVREKKVIQGFPENFNFDNVSKTQALKQLGNTITINVLEKIIENMQLEEYKNEEYSKAA